MTMPIWRRTWWPRVPFALLLLLCLLSILVHSPVRVAGAAGGAPQQLQSESVDGEDELSLAYEQLTDASSVVDVILVKLFTLEDDRDRAEELLKIAHGLQRPSEETISSLEERLAEIEGEMGVVAGGLEGALRHCTEAMVTLTAALNRAGEKDPRSSSHRKELTKAFVKVDQASSFLARLHTLLHG